MGESSGDLDLAKESVGAQRIGELRAQDLQGDEAAVLQVTGQIDSRHSATPELALEHVTVAEGVG